MNWHLKRFEELTTNELYEILRARAEVFVVEQTCIYQDCDLKDQKSWHLYSEENGEIVTYMRIIEKGVSYPEISMGRLLTRENHRKSGLSRQTIERGLDFVVNTLGESKIRVSGQLYMKEFYESMGFCTTSDVYLEDEIEHVEMLYDHEMVNK